MLELRCWTQHCKFHLGQQVANMHYKALLGLWAKQISYNHMSKVNISMAVESPSHIQIQNYRSEQKYAENIRASLSVKEFCFLHIWENIKGDLLTLMYASVKQCISFFFVGQQWQEAATQKCSVPECVHIQRDVVSNSTDSGLSSSHHPLLFLPCGCELQVW